MANQYDVEYNRTVPDDVKAPEISPYWNKGIRRGRSRFSSGAAVIATLSVVAAVTVSMLSSILFSIGTITDTTAELIYNTEEKSGFLPEDMVAYLLLREGETVTEGELPHEKGTLLLSSLDPDTDYALDILRNSEKIESLTFRTLRSEKEALPPDFEKTEFSQIPGTTDVSVYVKLREGDGRANAVFFIPDGGEPIPLVQSGDGWATRLTGLAPGKYTGEIKANCTLGEEEMILSHTVEFLVENAAAPARMKNISFTYVQGSPDVGILAEVDSGEAEILSVIVRLEGLPPVDLFLTENGYENRMPFPGEGKYPGETEIRYLLNGKEGTSNDPCTFEVAHVPAAPARMKNISFTYGQGSPDVGILAEVDSGEAEILSVIVRLEGLPPVDLVLTENGYENRMPFPGEGKYPGETEIRYLLNGKEETSNDPCTFEVAHVPAAPDTPFILYNQVPNTTDVLVRAGIIPHDGVIEAAILTLGNGKTYELRFEEGVYTALLSGLAEGTYPCTLSFRYLLDGERGTVEHSSRIDVSGLAKPMSFDGLTGAQDPLAFSATLLPKFTLNDSVITSVTVTENGKTVPSAFEGGKILIPKLSVGEHSLTVTAAFTTAGENDAAERKIDIHIRKIPKGLELSQLYPIPLYDGILSFESAYVPNDSKNVSAAVILPDGSRFPATMYEESGFFEVYAENVPDPGQKGYMIGTLEFRYTLDGYQQQTRFDILIYNPAITGDFPGNVMFNAVRSLAADDVDFYFSFDLHVEVGIKAAYVTCYDYMDPDIIETTVYTYGSQELSREGLCQSVTLRIPDLGSTSVLTGYVLFEIDGYEFLKSSSFYMM